MSGRVYIAIDLKSFYASVECADRGLDPLDTNLVVADPSRTEKTICLAVSPSLKHWGIPGRPRLFQVQELVAQANAERRRRAPGGRFQRREVRESLLRQDPSLEMDYLVAPPRMGRYMEVSSQVYEIYLHSVSPEHIHVYSIDEVFIDATPYLSLYGLSPRELAQKMIRRVLRETGVTATAGIGENLFLAKVAMDVVAKRIPPDANGVRIAEMDRMAYRRLLWAHRPLTDFWRVGPGYAEKLQRHGMFTMGDVARMSLENEDLLFRLFGVNAELLIDHAWGEEPCTLAAIQAYRPSGHSLGSGQVLQEPYDFAHARLVAREMGDQLALNLVEKHLVTDRLELYVGYDVASLKKEAPPYAGTLRTDHYGRTVPEGTHGEIRFPRMLSSSCILAQAAADLFGKIANPNLLVRRLQVVAGRVVREDQAATSPRQQELFPDPREEQLAQELDRERRRQQAVLQIRQKMGKNAILKGMNLEEGATARERNRQVGGHRI